MAYDEQLADRIRRVVWSRPDVVEKKMFGGLAFMLDGNARTMDFTGRPMEGYVQVAAAGCRTEKAIRPWVDIALAFVATLPAKKKARGRKRAP